MALSHTDQGLHAHWERVRERLREDLGDSVYRSWVKPLCFMGVEADSVRIAAPTRFVRDWIETHYMDRVRSLWSDENPGVRHVTLVVGASQLNPHPASPERPAVGIERLETHSQHREAALRAPVPTKSARPADSGVQARTNGIHDSADSLILSGSSTDGLDPRYTFDNFVTGKPNELAITPPFESQKHLRSPSIRSSSMAVLGWARPI